MRRSGQSGVHETADPAVELARRVVGLYGDPHVTWSVVIVVELDRSIDETVVRERLSEMLVEHPHLGRVPELQRHAAADHEAILDAFANHGFGDHDPLLRVSLSSTGTRLVVAAHHGVIDGLGMLGAASQLIGIPLDSNARGVPADAEPASFLLGSLRRASEALVAPPLRLAGIREPGARGDWLLTCRVAADRPSSAALVSAAVDVTRQWMRARPGRRGRQLVLAMGLSRRPGSPVPPPDRDTAFVRLRAGGVSSVAEAADLLTRTAPEPAFPVSTGLGIGPRLTRMLGSRLGSSMLLSNLGRVGSPGVSSLEFWPVPSGPAGLAVGLASTSRSTHLTLRARREWFDRVEAERILALLAEHLAP